MQDARGDLPVVMVGHSMGGLIATRYAQRHREDLAGLVLSGPAIGLGPVLEGWLADPSCRRTRSTAPCSRATRRSARPTPPTRSSTTAAGSAPTLQAFIAADDAIAAGPGFGDLPLLYVHGGDDQLVPVGLARPVVERLAGADSSCVVIDGARHEVFNETDQDETIGRVADFAERVT